MWRVLHLQFAFQNLCHPRLGVPHSVVLVVRTESVGDPLLLCAHRSGGPVVVYGKAKPFLLDVVLKTLNDHFLCSGNFRADLVVPPLKVGLVYHVVVVRRLVCLAAVHL